MFNLENDLNVYPARLTCGDCILSKDKKELFSIVWYAEYLGVGYLFDTHQWHVFLLFDNGEKAREVWNKQVAPLDEKSLRVRFVELNEDYEFILYSEPLSSKKVNWAFYRHLTSSEYYKQFKKGCKGKAMFRFGLYREGSEPTLLKAYKLITNIKFLEPSEVSRDTPEYIAREVYKRIRERRKYVI